MFSLNSSSGWLSLSSFTDTERLSDNVHIFSKRLFLTVWMLMLKRMDLDSFKCCVVPQWGHIGRSNSLSFLLITAHFSLQFCFIVTSLSSPFSLCLAALPFLCNLGFLWTTRPARQPQCLLCSVRWHPGVGWFKAQECQTLKSFSTL